MANKKTRALTNEEFYTLIGAIRTGFTTKAGVRIQANPQVAMILILQANLGLRISDTIGLRLSDIVKEGNRYHLNIVEQKTSKRREFTVPLEIYQYITTYMLENEIKTNQKLFDIGIRAVQKHLKITADYLEWDGIGTHSMRKMFCTDIYNSNGYNIELCRLLMQHSSIAVTQRYINIQTQQVENALANHIKLPA